LDIYICILLPYLSKNLTHSLPRVTYVRFIPKVWRDIDYSYMRTSWL